MSVKVFLKQKKCIFINILIILFNVNNWFGCAFVEAQTRSDAAGDWSRATPLTLAAAVDLALRDNPGLAELRARAEALAAVPSQAGSLPDPMLSFDAMNLPTDSFDLEREPMTQLQVGLSQRFPYPGKTRLREQAATHEAAAASESVAEMRLRLIRDVKSVWWRLFYFDKGLQVIETNKQLLRQFIEIAQTKYKVGQGLQQDVLLAHLELSKLLDRDIRFVGLRAAEAARLNALLDLPAGVHEVVLALDGGEPRLPVLRPNTELLELAYAARPVLAERERQIDAARARRELAEKELFPDLDAGASYGFRQGEDMPGSARPDFLSFRLSVNVPLFAGRKQKMAISQRGSEVLRRQYALQDERAAVQREVVTAVSDFERAREQFSLFKTGILPQARQTVASMLAGYHVSKVDFLNLVRAQITLYDYEARYWKVLSEAHTALARLVAAVGEEAIDGQ